MCTWVNCKHVQLRDTLLQLMPKSNQVELGGAIGDEAGVSVLVTPAAQMQTRTNVGLTLTQQQQEP